MSSDSPLDREARKNIARVEVLKEQEAKKIVTSPVKKKPKVQAIKRQRAKKDDKKNETDDEQTADINIGPLQEEIKAVKTTMQKLVGMTKKLQTQLTEITKAQEEQGTKLMNLIQQLDRKLDKMQLPQETKPNPTKETKSRTAWAQTKQTQPDTPWNANYLQSDDETDGKQNPDKELIVSNVPYNETENLSAIIMTIAGLKDTNLNNDDFRCFRAISKTYGPKTNSKPPKIVLTIEDDEIRNKIRKRNKTDITTAMLNIKPSKEEQKSPSTVYINQNLSREAATLFYNVRQYKKHRDYKFAWTRDGVCYLRKTETAKRFAIRNQDDLDKLALRDNADEQRARMTPRPQHQPLSSATPDPPPRPSSLSSVPTSSSSSSSPSTSSTFPSSSSSSSPSSSCSSSSFSSSPLPSA